MAGSSGEAIRGAVSLADEYTVLRKNDIDKAGLPILRLRALVPFQRIMMYERPKIKLVGDTKVSNFEQAEEINTVAVTSSTSGATMTVAIANATAAQLVVNQYLINENINYSATAGYTKPTNIQTVTSPEAAKILSIGEPGATNTNVVLLRMHQWTGGASTNVGAAGGTWAATDNIRRSARSTFDGANSGTAIRINPEIRTNYLQIFEKPFEVTELQQNVEKYSIDNPIEYQQYLAMMRFHREKEQFFLLDGYGAEGNASGRIEPTTWSLARIAGQNSLGQGPISEDNKGSFDEALRPFLEKLTTDTVWAFGGGRGLLRFEQLFQSYMHESPLSGEKGLGIQVKSYMHPLGHKVNFVYSREMSDSTRYRNSFLFANFDKIEHLVLKKKDGGNFDTYIDKGKNGTGLGDSEKTTKYQWRSIDGLGFNDTDAAAFEAYFPA